MELTDQELEQLEGYYTDSLSPAARQAVEERMAKERDYGEVARRFLKGIEALEFGRIKTHRLHLDGVQKSLHRSFWRHWEWLVAVAVGVGLILGGIWAFWKKEVPNPVQANGPIASFADHYPRLGNTMADNKLMTLRDSALNIYEARKYTNAILLMRDWLARNPDDEEVQFYLGVAYLATKQIKEADVVFTKLKYTQIEQKEAVLWYLAKCEYELGNDREALDLLKIVQATGSRPLIRKADSLIIVINNNK